jgi:tetratricopeptide (TPR) repeat protein
MTTTLPESIAGRVERLCAEGDSFAAASRLDAAVLRFTTALRLLPRPQDRWNVTPRILASVIDLCFDKGDLESARHAALAALDCPDVRENPALRLKLGEIYFEQGDLDAAREEFVFAAEVGGREVFEGEDPKYWEFASQATTSG